MNCGQPAWTALQLDHHLLHSEDLLNFSPERAARLFAAQLDGARMKASTRVVTHDAQHQLLALTQQVGEKLTLRGLLLAVTGEDILHDIRPLVAAASGFVAGSGHGGMA